MVGRLVGYYDDGGVIWMMAKLMLLVLEDQSLS